MNILLYACFSVGFALAVYDRDASEAIWIVSSFLWYYNYKNK